MKNSHLFNLNLKEVCKHLGVTSLHQHMVINGMVCPFEINTYTTSSKGFHDVVYQPQPNLSGKELLCLKSYDTYEFNSWMDKISESGLIIFNRHYHATMIHLNGNRVVVESYSEKPYNPSCHLREQAIGQIKRFIIESVWDKGAEAINHVSNLYFDKQLEVKECPKDKFVLSLENGLRDYDLRPVDEQLFVIGLINRFLEQLYPRGLDSSHYLTHAIRIQVMGYLKEIFPTLSYYIMKITLNTPNHVLAGQRGLTLLTAFTREWERINRGEN